MNGFPYLLKKFVFQVSTIFSNFILSSSSGKEIGEIDEIYVLTCTNLVLEFRCSK